MRVLRVTAAAATATSCLRHCMAHSVRLLFPAIVPVHGSWMLSITSRSPCLSSPKNRSLDQFSPSELAVLLSRTLPLNQGSTFFFFCFFNMQGDRVQQGLGLISAMQKLYTFEDLMIRSRNGFRGREIITLQIWKKYVKCYYKFYRFYLLFLGYVLFSHEFPRVLPL